MGGEPPSPTPLLSVEVGRDEPISARVVEAVSAASDTRPTDLPFLNDVVDPDALDAVFAGRPRGGRVSFEYAGYTVSVAGNEISLHEVGGGEG